MWSKMAGQTSMLRGIRDTQVQQINENRAGSAVEGGDLTSGVKLRL